DVFAALPKEQLVKGILRPGQMNPLEPTVPEQRENPNTTDATATWPRFLEEEHAAVNFFYTILNQDDPAVLPANEIPYKTDYEPWLYDRSSAMYVLYMRSGFLKPLREAVRAADFYRRHLSTAGFFTLNPSQDVKYSYLECLAYTYWLTGEDSFRTPF